MTDHERKHSQNITQHMLSVLTFCALLLPGSLLALLVTGSTPDSTSLAEVRRTFEEFKIPADAHLNFNPVVLFEVDFPQPADAASIRVTMPGTQLAQNVTAGPPQFALYRSERASTSPATDGPFLVAIIDPDAPTPQAPTVAQFLHFIGGGYCPDDATQYLQRRSRPRPRSPGHENLKLTNDMPAIIEFLQPQPPVGSDPHRYLFLVYEEPQNFSRQTIVNSSASCLNSNVSTFAAATGLGDPLDGTFILVGPAS